MYIVSIDYSIWSTLSGFCTLYKSTVCEYSGVLVECLPFHRALPPNQTGYHSPVLELITITISLLVGIANNLISS